MMQLKDYGDSLNPLLANVWCMFNPSETVIHVNNIVKLHFFSTENTAHLVSKIGIEFHQVQQFFDLI
jgi:hypothetical protein